jgi:predicted nuclease of predicted toxin-antitoxin system
MADLYADEQFPREVVNQLRDLAHDVLTVQEADNRGEPDENVLAFATDQGRAVVTLNRKDFFRLHRESDDHGGILACTEDTNWDRLAKNVHVAIGENKPLAGKLIRVNRKG